MFPLHLYAHVRFLMHSIAHETAGAARTRSSLRPLLFEARTKLKTSGKTMSREREGMFSRHRPAPVLDPIGDDRAIQYSRVLMMNRNALEYWITRFRG